MPIRKKHFQFLGTLFISLLPMTNFAGQNPNGLEVFDGLWGWEPSNFPTTCDKNPHTLTFSENGKKAYLEFIKPQGESDENITVYSVHEIKGNRITMSIDGEERLDDEGNPVVWDLVLLNKNEYVWHRHDWSFYQFTPPVVRCG
ncbi:hypothetical protein [Marinobacter nauticus]|uniref:hypothetical protein n=1 Tax=Marinobacter nauticus TaxID=2743 RepID=UPI004044837F